MTFSPSAPRSLSMPSSMNKRIAIFGGAFDPPHRGHERALSAFIDTVQPDIAYVIPSGTPPHKKLSCGAEDHHRLAMAKIAFERISPKVTVSDMEILSPEVSYTLLTVDQLKKKHPDAEIYLFVGTDQFLCFETWREPETLLSLCTLCVMDRFSKRDDLLAKKRELEENFQAQCLLLSEKPYIMSSTDIRSELKEEGYSFRISPLVNEYISENGLYGSLKDPVRDGIVSRLKAEISKERLEHILSVEREVAEISYLLGYEKPREMRLAALCHDLTKEKSLEEQKKMAEALGITFSSEDLLSPAVLHGITAAESLEREGILSPEMISAIRYHTTGKEDMSLPEKILYFADYVEETRPYEACRRVRGQFYDSMPETVAERRLHFDRALRSVMQETVDYLMMKQRPVHPLTLQALNGFGRNSMTSQEKAKRIAAILDDKKGKDLRILKVDNETVITDYFVIATAGSSTHLKALCDEVSYKLREEDGITVFRTEGYSGGGWILMDYGDIIVHIFDKEQRQFFNLEKLWNSAEVVDFECKED